MNELEAEAICVIREVIARFERLALLISSGKNSIVVTHLSKKAFYPARIPLPLIPIDTGQNYRETLQVRDELARKRTFPLFIESEQANKDNDRVQEETGINASRKRKKRSVCGWHDHIKAIITLLTTLR